MLSEHFGVVGLFLILQKIKGPIAQLGEHRADNAGVIRSIRIGPTTKICLANFRIQN